MKHGGKRKGSGRKPGPTNETIRKIAVASVEQGAKDAVVAAIEEVKRAEGLAGKRTKRAATVLEEFMLTFAGMAATYQPLPPGSAVPEGRSPDDEKFRAYAKLAVDTAGMLAGYQQPKFKAIQVAFAPPPEQPTHAPRPGDDAKVVGRIGNPALVYKRMIQGVE